MTNRDRKGVAEIERVTGAKVRHFTAEQVIRGEELKVLPPRGRRRSDRGGGAEQPVEIARAGGRVARASASGTA